MLEQELLIQVVQTLEKSEIPYMLTGSYVSSLQGYPRSTHDIDIVVLIDQSKIPGLKGAFADPDFYLDEQSMSEAIQQGGMFNLVESSVGTRSTSGSSRIRPSIVRGSPGAMRNGYSDRRWWSLPLKTPS